MRYSHHTSCWLHKSRRKVFFTSREIPSKSQSHTLARIFTARVSKGSQVFAKEICRVFLLDFFFVFVSRVCLNLRPQVGVPSESLASGSAYVCLCRRYLRWFTFRFVVPLDDRCRADFIELIDQCKITKKKKGEEKRSERKHTNQPG